MKFVKKFLPQILLILFAISCSHKPAKIVNKSKISYGKNSSQNQEKYRSNSSVKKLSTNEIEVKAGDTLYSISRQNQVSLRDLIEINNLSAPYYLKAGDKIKIAKETKIAQEKKTQEVAKEVESEPSAVDKTLDKMSKFSWPLHGKIISKFGPKSGGLYNDGINIKAAEGAPVKASASGSVAYVGNELKGYGNLVIIKHVDGWITAYAHLKNFAVKRGAQVKKGDKIGEVGATGNVKFSQLYFSLRKGRDAVNPQNYLKS